MYPEVRFERIPIRGNSPGAELTSGQVDIGPLARELPPDEVTAFTGAFGYPPTAIRVAGGSYRTPDKALAIAFLVNSANPIARLTFAQIDAIYAKHRLPGIPEAHTWGDLGLTGDWKDRPIHVWGLVRPGESPHIQVSGNITRFLSERVLGGSEFRDDIGERTTVGAKISAFDAIAEQVAKDPEALGYGGFNNIIPGTKALAIGATEKGPFYSCTFDEVATQRYPLSRVIYFYLNHRPGEKVPAPLLEFVKFVLSRNGQQDVIREGIFLPLPYRLAQQDLATLWERETKRQP
jgi:phosphate transport system substrate-binding protein